MKSVSGKRLCKALEKKGWKFKRIRGSHHIYTDPDQRLSASVPVHGNKTLKTGTQQAIMKAAGLTDADI